MKSSCIKTRELFNGHKNGSLKDAESINEAREHVKTCDSCRDAALDNSISDLFPDPVHPLRVGENRVR